MRARPFSSVALISSAWHIIKCQIFVPQVENFYMNDCFRICQLN